MWPWGHLAFAYVTYSAVSRLGWDSPPAAVPTLLVGVGALLPDLVDKPLSWTFEVFTTGYGAMHSVFVAGPLVALALWAAVARGRPAAGVAFALGVGTHLIGDVLSAIAHGQSVVLGRVLWPVAAVSGYATDRSFVERFGYYFGEFLEELLRGGPYAVAYVSVFVAVFALWVVDGAPVVGDLLRRLDDRSGP